jgi:hypothetical protein
VAASSPSAEIPIPTATKSDPLTLAPASLVAAADIPALRFVRRGFFGAFAVGNTFWADVAVGTFALFPVVEFGLR